MSLVIPDTLELQTLQRIFTDAMHIRLYGNNVTPVGTSTAASFTEITGANYAAFPLTFANWTFTSGDPSFALYNSTITWLFNAVINAPGTIYGYYIQRDSDSKLIAAERFPAANVPFLPIAGSQIRILPKFTCQSEF